MREPGPTVDRRLRDRVRRSVTKILQTLCTFPCARLEGGGPKTMFVGTYYFVDVTGNRLPEGTAIKFPSKVRHEAIIAYDSHGQQLLLEKSKKYGKPTVTNPAEDR